MQTVSTRTILRIELWHALLLFGLLIVSAPLKMIEPGALLLGGFFMAVNFMLLAYGVAWALKPLAGKGRVRTGVALLVLKMAIFLGLLLMLFFKFPVDPISFAAGFSVLLIAMLIETVLGTTGTGPER